MKTNWLSRIGSRINQWSSVRGASSLIRCENCILVEWTNKTNDHMSSQCFWSSTYGKRAIRKRVCLAMVSRTWFPYRILWTAVPTEFSWTTVWTLRTFSQWDFMIFEDDWTRSPHRAEECVKLKEQHFINFFRTHLRERDHEWLTPSKMVDLWPIDRIWCHLINVVFNEWPLPMSDVEWKERIQSEWDNVPKELCIRLIHEIPATRSLIMTARRFIHLGGAKLHRIDACATFVILWMTVIDLIKTVNCCW